MNGAIKLSEALGANQSVIGLTVVAIGTSLPELATSAVAAYRRQIDLAVGNIVGSNIFNIFFVLAISAVINPLPIDGANYLSLIIAIVATLLL